MDRLPHRRLRAFIGATALALLAALLLVPATSGNSAQEQLQAHVAFVGNDGSIPACSSDGSNCTAANTLWYVIYVRNENPLPDKAQFPGRRSRATLPNAYVVHSIDYTIRVDGVEWTHDTLTPPPNAYYRPWSGHWPVSIPCPPAPAPCDVIDPPAVLPGENIAVIWTGWFHASDEPNGSYVFTFTVHGTLNGMPVDLTDSSPPIRMTA